MRVYLIDGTYELFRHFHGAPPVRVDGVEVAAARGVMRSVVSLLENGVRHLAVATDQVIESFRNDLWPGYKTGDGVPPELLRQFPIMERAVAATGVRVWPMLEFEADDALAAAAARADADPAVSHVVIATPDKDLAQCVVGTRVVQYDRLRDNMRTAADVRARYGVDPPSIPDYLALVGDSADGFPGIAGWGAKSAGSVLGRYRHLEEIPADPTDWDVKVRGAVRLSAALRAEWENALLFRRLATLRADTPVLTGGVAEIAWRGPADDIEEAAAEVGASDVPGRLAALNVD